MDIYAFAEVVRRALTDDLEARSIDFSDFTGEIDGAKQYARENGVCGFVVDVVDDQGLQIMLRHICHRAEAYCEEDSEDWPGYIFCTARHLESYEDALHSRDIKTVWIDPDGATVAEFLFVIPLG